MATAECHARMHAPCHRHGGHSVRVVLMVDPWSPVVHAASCSRVQPVPPPSPRVAKIDPGDTSTSRMDVGPTHPFPSSALMQCDSPGCVFFIVPARPLREAGAPHPRLPVPGVRLIREDSHPRSERPGPRPAFQRADATSSMTCCPSQLSATAPSTCEHS